MKIAYFCPRRHTNKPQWLEPVADELAKRGYTLVVNKLVDNADVILGMSHTVQDDVWTCSMLSPNARLFCYNWDVYKWVWEHPKGKEHDWNKWGKLLSKCEQVWNPSECTVKRMKQWYNLDNGVVLHTFVPLDEFKDLKPKDRGYVMTAMRPLPDPQDDWVENACRELNIPLRQSRQSQSFEEYKKMLAGCSFFVSHHWEASTGGLSLVEARFLGKEVIKCGSEWNGGKEYVKGGHTFHDYDELVSLINYLWNNKPHKDSNPERIMPEHLSLKRFVDDIESAISTRRN